MEFIQEILVVCGGISIIGGAVAVIWKWVKPSVKLHTRVTAIEESFEEIKSNLDDLDKKQQKTMKCLLAFINHEITGNGIEEMKKVRDELTEVLIEK